MKSRDNSTMHYSTAFRVLGPPLYGAHSCVDRDILTVWEPGVTNGDRKSPNKFGFSKTTSVGLRGSTKCVAPEPWRLDRTYTTEEGPKQSVLDSKGSLAPDTLSSKAYEQAYQKLVTSVRGDLDVSTDLFQFRQFLNTSDRILNLTRTLRTSWRNASKGKGPVKEAADLYLEWAYGIKPSVQTMVVLYRKLMIQCLTGEGLIHCRGRGQLRDSVKIPGVIQVIPNGTGNLPIRFECLTSARCQIDIYLKADQTEAQKLSGYTSLNPISWLYEATPYSFVLDWFVNLGGYLRAIETMLIHRLRFQSGCVTYTLKQDTTCIDSVIVDRAGAPYPLFEFSGITGRHTFVQTNRSVLSSFPVPHLPSWNPSLGSTRMLNAAALLSQLLPDMFGSNRRTRLPVSVKL